MLMPVRRRKNVKRPKFTKKWIRSFWNKVDCKDDVDCWEWTASKIHNGYGQKGWSGDDGDKYKPWLAHRLSWMIAHRRFIPRGNVIMHMCDNPSCVNPSHLSLGTQLDNINDKVNKGRQACGDDVAIYGERHGHTQLTNNLVDAMAHSLRLGLTRKRVAEKYGVKYGIVKRIASGTDWIHITGGPIDCVRELPSQQKKKVSQQQIDNLYNLYKQGISQTVLAPMFGISQSTVSNILRRNCAYASLRTTREEM